MSFSYLYIFFQDCFFLFTVILYTRLFRWSTIFEENFLMKGFELRYFDSLFIALDFLLLRSTHLGFEGILYDFQVLSWHCDTDKAQQRVFHVFQSIC